MNITSVVYKGWVEGGGGRVGGLSSQKTKAAKLEPGWMLGADVALIIPPVASQAQL